MLLIFSDVKNDLRKAQHVVMSREVIHKILWKLLVPKTQDMGYIVLHAHNKLCI